MTDSYKGDSAAKKIVRHYYWATIVEFLGKKGTHLYLASRDMGDFRAMRALGLNGIGAERDTDAFEEATVKFPDADVRFGDVADVAESLNTEIESALLDFCCQLSEDMISTVVRVAAKICRGGFLGVGYMRGREAAGHSCGISRRNRRAISKIWKGSASKALASGDVKSVINAHKSITKDGDPDPRIIALRDILTMRLLAAGFAPGTRTPYLVDYWHYQSATESSNGVPMTYALFAIGRPPPDHTCYFINEPVVGNSTKLKEVALELGHYENFWHHVGDKREDVGRDMTSSEVADLLNINSGTVAAWRAHETMRVASLDDCPCGAPWECEVINGEKRVPMCFACAKKRRAQ